MDYKKRISYKGQRYNKAMVTPWFVFYTDNSDGLVAVRIEDNKRFSGYGAEECLMTAIEDKEYTWASRPMKHNIKLMEEQE